MQYYIANGKQPLGPFDLNQLREMNITPETLVWNQSMPDWQRADQVEELRTQLLGLPNGGASVVPPVNPQGERNQYGPAMPQNPYGAQPHPYSQGLNADNGLPPCPPDYLAFAIIVTLFCCLPFGIVSIVYAAKVSVRYNRGDYHGALDASNSAKRWAWISLIAVLVFFIAYIFIFLIGMSEYFSLNNLDI